MLASEKKTIGVIMTGDIPYYAKMHKAFVSRLAKEGYGDSEILLQRPYPDLIAWSNAARKLIALDVGIIVTYGAPATLAAINERSNKPIIYAGVYNPDAIGVSGKNVTGAIAKVPISSLIRYLKGITSISNLGIIYSELEKDSSRQAAELDEIARELGFKAVKINIKMPEDVRKIKTMGRLDALFLTHSASVNMAIDSIVDFAKTNKIPTASALKGEQNSDIIITLSASPEEQGEIAAEKAVRILRGASAGSIATTNSKDIELIFNLKENMSMGFKIPMDLVTGATKIIQ
jgi:putative ABC transport system substrate-binding protein